MLVALPGSVSSFPDIKKVGDTYSFDWSSSLSIGKSPPLGQFPRSGAGVHYISGWVAMGCKGIRIAVLNANYCCPGSRECMTIPMGGICKHEFVLRWSP